MNTKPKIKYLTSILVALSLLMLGLVVWFFWGNAFIRWFKDDSHKNALIELAATNTSQQRDTAVIFYSGDGGWREIDQVIAKEMGENGYSTVGIDTLAYYWHYKSPEQSTQELAQIMQDYRQKWGVKRFVLLGFSFGADVLPFLYNGLAAADQAQVDAVILLSFSRGTIFEIEIKSWLNTVQEINPLPQLVQIPKEKILCIYGSEEASESGCTAAEFIGTAQEIKGGHHFDEDYLNLAKKIMSFINTITHD